MKPQNAMANLFDAFLNVSLDRLSNWQPDWQTWLLFMHTRRGNGIWSTYVRQVLHGSQPKSIL